MSRILSPARFVGSLLAALTLGSSALAEGPAAQSLFDGKTLSDWSGNLQYWRVQDGAITGEIPEGTKLTRNEWIWWKGVTGDFDLSVEFRITGVPSANSGIQYRSRRQPDGEAAGYQADLDDGKLWLGRIYEESGRGMIAERGTRGSIAPDGRRWSETFAEPASFAAFVHKDDWNTYRVVARASHVETWINGVLFSQLDDHQADKAAFTGQLAFQLHAGPGPAKIEFRHVLLTPLGETKKPVYPDVKPVAQAPNPEMPAAIKPLGDDGKPLNLDFETGTLADWKAEGDAWEGQPVAGDLTNARGKGHSEHQGKYWIGGYENFGDERKGRLTSASFAVTHPWASFLVGGGANAKLERVEIVDEKTGQVLQSASGQDREPMRRVAVDLQAHQGKRIFVRLVDEGTSGWGHLNFDDFVFHDQAPAAVQVARVPTPASPGGDRVAHMSESPVLWHLGPNPAKPTAIANADAQNVVATMKLTPGFQAELIAAEPDVRQPIAFCMDERGRLWIAEGYSYPQKQPEGQGKDRIIILEDKDGDGVFETRKVFKEGLNLMSGLEIGFGGVSSARRPSCSSFRAIRTTTRASRRCCSMAGATRIRTRR